MRHGWVSNSLVDCSRCGDHPLVGDVRTIGLAGAIDFLRRDENDVPQNTDADDIAMRVYDELLATRA